MFWLECLKIKSIITSVQEKWKTMWKFCQIDVFIYICLKELLLAEYTELYIFKQVFLKFIWHGLSDFFIEFLQFLNVLHQNQSCVKTVQISCFILFLLKYFWPFYQELVVSMVGKMLLATFWYFFLMLEFKLIQITLCKTLS